MTTKRITAIVLTLGTFALQGCMSAGGGSLSARVDQHDQQINTLMSQVGQVEQVLPGQAEMWSQMQTMRQEINILNGKMDDGQIGGSSALDERVSRLETLVRQMASQMGINVSSLNEAGSGGYTAPPVSPPPSTTTGNSAVAGNSDTATALYDAGIKSFDDRRYKDAIVSFKDFAATYPGHKLSSNAHFWQGESYYQLKDYARAALAYQEVIANFPGSSKLQSSLLKQGMSLYYAGKAPAGKERLQEVINRYPNSPEATRAKQFLAQNK